MSDRRGKKAGGSSRAGGKATWGACWRRSSRRWESLGGDIARATGWQVWNPGLYGEPWHARFRRAYPPGPAPILFLGLNPGPYGMAQTGVPFTDVKRLHARLPRLARILEKAHGPLLPPGLAPASLHPFLKRTFESSSVRVYLFLEKMWGDAEAGCRHAVVANPCPLLFMDADGNNRTPADLRRAAGGARRQRAVELQEQATRLRRDNCLDAVATLQPAGAVMLGKDVQRAVGADLRQALGDSRVLDWEHPARAVPETWSTGLAAAIRARRWRGPDGG